MLNWFIIFSVIYSLFFSNTVFQAYGFLLFLHYFVFLFFPIAFTQNILNLSLTSAIYVASNLFWPFFLVAYFLSCSAIIIWFRHMGDTVFGTSPVSLFFYSYFSAGRLNSPHPCFLCDQSVARVLPSRFDHFHGLLIILTHYAWEIFVFFFQIISI